MYVIVMLEEHHKCVIYCVAQSQKQSCESTILESNSREREGRGTSTYLLDHRRDLIREYTVNFG